MPIVVYRWEERNPRTGRWKMLGWMMDEAAATQWAEKHQAELRKVEGSREERQDYYGSGYGQFTPPAPDKR